MCSWRPGERCPGQRPRPECWPVARTGGLSQGPRKRCLSVTVLPRSLVPRKRLTHQPREVPRMPASAWPPHHSADTLHSPFNSKSNVSPRCQQSIQGGPACRHPRRCPGGMKAYTARTRASPSHLEAAGQQGLSPFSHLPAHRKRAGHSMGRCHLRCQPISTTSSVLNISCFCRVFWRGLGNWRAESAPNSAGARSLTSTHTWGFLCMDPTESPG